MSSRVKTPGMTGICNGITQITHERAGSTARAPTIQVAPTQSAAEDTVLCNSSTRSTVPLRYYCSTAIWCEFGYEFGRISSAAPSEELQIRILGEFWDGIETQHSESELDLASENMYCAVVDCTPYCLTGTVYVYLHLGSRATDGTFYSPGAGVMSWVHPGAGSSRGSAVHSVRGVALVLALATLC